MFGILTAAVGVTPTGIQRDVSVSGARDTVAPAGSLRNVCVCEMFGQNLAIAESFGARSAASVAIANAESIDVGAAVNVGLPHGLLGRHVHGRAQ